MTELILFYGNRDCTTVPSTFMRRSVAQNSIE